MAKQEQKSRWETVLDPETGKLLLRYDRSRDTIQVKPKWAALPREVNMRRLRGEAKD